MKIDNSGYFLKIWLSSESISKIPESWRNPTKTGADFMLLANDRERILIDTFLLEGCLLPKDLCYDWILVYEEDKVEQTTYTKEQLLKAIQRMEDYPCGMSCYLKVEEVRAAKDMRDNMIRVLKEEFGL